MEDQTINTTQKRLRRTMDIVDHADHRREMQAFCDELKPWVRQRGLDPLMGTS